MNIQFTVDNGNPSESRGEPRVKNILLVGNFSQTDPGGDSGESVAHRINIFPVDPVDPDAALSRVKPSIQVGNGGPVLSFDNMDHFHPDALYQAHPAFSLVHELKRALADPSKADQAAILCRQLLGQEDEEQPIRAEAPESKAVRAEDESSGDMFSRLLGKKPSNEAPLRGSTRRLLEQAVAADIAPESSQDTQRLQNDLDTWCENAMRELMRDPAFRKLEANWRSLQLMGEQIEFDEGLALWLVDLGATPPSAWASQLSREILQKLAGEPVDLIILLHEFSDSSDSLDCLGELGDAAEQIGAPLLAAANPGLAGMNQDFARHVAADGSDIDTTQSQEMETLRRGPRAARIGLGFPRILLRQPYGRRSDPVDTFTFEELEPGPDHESFLWGNPAIALAILWLREQEPGNQALHLEDLPMVTYDDGSGQAIKPPSEVYLSDSAAEKLLELGIMPLIGRRGQTGLLLPRLQSVAKPPGILRG